LLEKYLRAAFAQLVKFRGACVELAAQFQKEKSKAKEFLGG
jgi:hypothetical protein